MNIKMSGLKQDYSFLFNNSNGKKNSNDIFSAINLSDYNTIKSGSYGKLLKAYYKKEDVDAKDAASDKTTAKVESSQTKEFKEIQTEADKLRDSASKLMQKGSKSVFGEENMEKVYSAVSKFVDSFNATVKKGEESDTKAIFKEAEGLVTLAKDYEEELKNMGITMDKDNKLVVDKDVFLKADVNEVKELFNGKNSFAYLTSLRAVSMSNTAYSESNKSSLYTGEADYTVPSAGDLFDSII